MSATRLFCVTGMLAVLVAGIGVPAANAQNPKELMWTHAFDLSSRKYGEKEFTAKTQKFGVEAFKDFNNDLGIYVSQTGSLAVVKSPAFAQLTKAIKPSKGPEAIVGLDLPSRKAGVNVFDEKTKKHSVEVFRDVNTDTWFYITEQGNIAATPGKYDPSRNAAKKPKFLYSVDLQARPGGEKSWTKAAKYGIEVYLDENTDNLIYVCETGSIAVIPEDLAVSLNVKGAKAPELLHGLDLDCRKHREFLFSKDTPVIGVEAYLDVNSGNLLFIAQNGSLAVCPGSKDIKAPSPKVKTPDWKHGLDVSVRKFGESDFTDKTQKFGIEVFRDDTLGVTLYIGETGSISAVKQ